MSEPALARRYARALKDAADARGLLAPVGEDLQALLALLAAEPALDRLLRAPQIAREEKRALLRRVLGRRMQPLVIGLLLLLLEKRRFAELPAIAAGYRELWEERQGILRAEVTTSAPLPGDLRGRLLAALETRTGKRILIQERVDPALIGGAVVRIGDRVLDGSVARRLQEMRRALLAAEFAPAAAPLAGTGGNTGEGRA